MEAPPPQGVAVRAGRLFDPKSGANLQDQVILIKGDRITEVGPSERVMIPQGARLIDLRGATVLPGLIDRHVHLMQDQQPNDGLASFLGLHYALKDLQAGFTSLQDMGSASTYATVELRDAINKGWVPGPRLQVAGPRINPRANGYYPAPSTANQFGFGTGLPIWQLTGNVNLPWLARAAVRDQFDLGAQDQQCRREIAAESRMAAFALRCDVADIAAAFEAIIVGRAPPLALVVEHAAGVQTQIPAEGGDTSMGGPGNAACRLGQRWIIRCDARVVCQPRQRHARIAPDSNSLK